VQRKILKAIFFQAAKMLISVFVPTAMLLAGVITLSAAPDTVTESDELREAVEDVLQTGDSLPDTVVNADSLPAPEGDEYLFAEESDDKDTGDTTTEKPATEKPPSGVRTSGKGGELFLKLMTAVQNGIGKNVRFPGEPVALLKKHAVKLGVLTVSLLVILLTISYYRERREKGRFMTTTRLSVMDKEVQRACRYIEENFDAPDLGIDRICSALVTGGGFLEALFVKELGLTVEDFIIQVRINRAKIFLRNNHDCSASTLAGQCGFSDEGDFLERFAAITGCTLEEYRSNIVEKKDASV
jgi:AraC-like DNA-binding protein